MIKKKVADKHGVILLTCNKLTFALIFQVWFCIFLWMLSMSQLFWKLSASDYKEADISHLTPLFNSLEITKGLNGSQTIRICFHEHPASQLFVFLFLSKSILMKSYSSLLLSCNETHWISQTRKPTITSYKRTTKSFPNF